MWDFLRGVDVRYQGKALEIFLLFSFLVSFILFKYIRPMPRS